MKLRLQIQSSPDSSSTFEHGGPVIHIGKDPASELALQGEASKSVSWNHARIDLAVEGATLTDVASSNGTLLNDRIIQGPQALRSGDRIQLGFTGPSLKVVELELPPAAPPEKPPSSGLRWAGIGGGIAAVACFVVIVAIIWMSRSPAPTSNAAVPTGSEPQATLPQAPGTKPNLLPPLHPPQPPPLAPPPADLPNVEEKPVGSYLSLDKGWPGMLLQRQGEANQWTPLPREGKVTTAQTLIGLPGFRSTVTLDSGVYLTLWGNLPEFSSFPPILESVVMLNAPPTGIDLDLNLDHGRIHLANRKPSGAAVVRLRFRRELWTLILPDAKSEVCVELWEIPVQAATRNAGSPSICLGLFTKGRAQLEVPGKRFDLPDRSKLWWVNGAAALPSQETLPELPDWWAKPPDRSNSRVASAMLDLKDWKERIDRSTEPIDTILTNGVRESLSTTYRVLGLVFLAALDDKMHWIEFLEDRQQDHADVRGAAAHLLRVRLACRSVNAADLIPLVKERLHYSKDKAALLVQLLQPYSEEDRKRPETYQTLIGYLEHENLAIRDLAYWHLSHLDPKGGQEIPHDPLGSPEALHKNVEAWKKLIPAGQVPSAQDKK